MGAFFAWLILGLLAGFIASLLVNKRGEGMLGDLLLGIVGAFVGGFLANLMGIQTNGTFGWSLIVAVCGSVIVLVIYHVIVGRGKTSPRV